MGSSLRAALGLSEKVGNAALGVPRVLSKTAKWNGEGAVPYTSVFLINKIDLRAAYS